MTGIEQMTSQHTTWPYIAYASKQSEKQSSQQTYHHPNQPH